MTAKILVADDSPTIQKVVGITLASEPYELVECADEKSLFKELSEEEYDLVLLDFNLSSDKDGYDLAAEVLKLSPHSSIMAMLGTFDSVDDSKLSECGIRAKIVKPFESGLFIQQCRDLLESSEDEEYEESDEVVLEDQESDEDDEEETSFESDENDFDSTEDDDIGADWVVDSPEPQSIASIPTMEEDIQLNLDDTSNDSQNNLVSEVEGWGMAVPGVIGEKKIDAMTLFPPVIDDEFNFEPSISMEQIEKIEEIKTEEVVEAKDDMATPSDGDLEYPDMGTESEDKGSEPHELENVTLSSKLVSLDDLAPEDEKTKVEEPASENEERDLASEIEDDVSADDFWAADNNESDSESNEEELRKEIDEVESSIDLSELDNDKPSVNFDEVEEPAVIEDTYFEKEQVQVAASMEDLSNDEVVEQIKESLTPIIEELVKTYCREKVEQVAWEVIPDLAENLIRKEIQEISQSMQN